MEPDDHTPNRTFRLTVWTDQLLNRIGARSQFARDSVLATGVVVSSLVLVDVMFVAVPDLFQHETTAVITFATVVAVQGALVCLRRVRPASCLVLIVVCQVLLLLLLPDDSNFRGFATAIAAYTIGTIRPPRTIVTLMALATAIETFGGALVPVIKPSLDWLAVTTTDSAVELGPLALLTLNLVSNMVVYAVPALAGFHVTTRREHLRLVKLRAAEAIKAEQVAAQAATTAERSRLARELHDIAAHHLSGMVVQAAAVERLIDRDPVAAKESTAWIRSQGKETLKNLRLVVGVLRDRPSRPGEPVHGELGEDSAPVPGLAVLGSLVSTARRLGNPVAVEQHGQPRQLPPIADVTLYRVLQEGLSNIRQYAPHAEVTVTVTYQPAQVSVQVYNDPAPQGGEPVSSHRRQGLGLIGMRERVQLIGGTLSTGPTDNGGWHVAVTVPDKVPASSGVDAQANRPAEIRK